MRARLLRRIGQLAATVLGASALVWGLTLLAPGDPARQVLLAQGVSSPRPAQVTQVRAELGLDAPAAVRYGRWLAGAVRGELGTSWRTGRPVAAELAAGLGPTLRLSGLALLLALAAAVPVATAGAWWAGRWPDALGRGLVFTGATVPGFVLGVVLLEVVVIGWGLGQVVTDGSWSGAWLPALVLGVPIAAEWARVLRGGLQDGLAAAHCETARARGAGGLRLLLVHAVPHAAGPFLAVAAMTVGGLLAGAAVTETLFTWPGVGRLLVEAIAARDLPVVQAVVLLGVLAFGLAGLAAQSLTALVDPRTRRQR